MWYKVKEICIKKSEKNFYCNEFFYLNNNKKLLMWYKKWKKWQCFNVNCYWKIWKSKKKTKKNVNSKKHYLVIM